MTPATCQAAVERICQALAGVVELPPGYVITGTLLAHFTPGPTPHKLIVVLNHAPLASETLIGIDDATLEGLLFQFFLFVQSAHHTAEALIPSLDREERARAEFALRELDEALRAAVDLSGLQVLQVRLPSAIEAIQKREQFFRG